MLGSTKTTVYLLILSRTTSSESYIFDLPRNLLDLAEKRLTLRVAMKLTDKWPDLGTKLDSLLNEGTDYLNCKTEYTSNISISCAIGRLHTRWVTHQIERNQAEVYSGTKDVACECLHLFPLRIIANSSWLIAPVK